MISVVALATAAVAAAATTTMLASCARTHPILRSLVKCVRSINQTSSDPLSISSRNAYILHGKIKNLPVRFIL